MVGFSPTDLCQAFQNYSHIIIIVMIIMAIIVIIVMIIIVIIVMIIIMKNLSNVPSSLVERRPFLSANSLKESMNWLT